MKKPAMVDPPPPLAEKDGVPKVYSALGAFFHLEHLEPDDEARLDRVSALVDDWFGERLTFTDAPFVGGIPPFRRADLDYISGYCRTLDLPADPEERAATISFDFGRDGYSLRCSGGAKRSHASPYYYGFWSTFGGSGVEDRIPACSVLRLTVPDTWPTEDFAARVTAIARELRLRWAAAGLTYATWKVYGYQVEDEAIYAHARRYLGYDVPHYLNSTVQLFDAIRSVNWLTFVGPALAGRLREAGQKLESSGPLQVSSVGSSVLIRAGDRPERGDVNRLQIPHAYQAADALVRPVRASGTPAQSLVLFGSPWSVAETSEWLQRFGNGGVLPPPPPPASPDDDIPF
ncbi:type VI immunity family protein [Sorangium sp. So ce429]